MKRDGRRALTKAGRVRMGKPLGLLMLTVALMGMPPFGSRCGKGRARSSEVRAMWG